MDLTHKVKKTIEKEHLIEDGDNVLVGLSGGIDSTALLYVLAELAIEKHYKIGVAHVNHLLREDESLRDQAFVERLAEMFSIKCHVKTFDVKGYAKVKGVSLQHAGRDIRYGFFEDVARENGYDRIAIAHNLDDQVETFLLRMLKGSGLRGLVSIPIKRDRIVRPFLYVYRSEIEDYVKANGIMYVEDSSNNKITYERNYLRKEIMPLMDTLNPVFKEKIYMLLRDITEVNSVFEKKASRFLDKLLIQGEDQIYFEIDGLSKLDAETRFRVIAHTLNRIKPGFIALREHYRLIDKILNGRRPNLSVMLPYNIKVLRVYKKLIFTTGKEMPVINGVFPVTLGENILEPFRLVLGIARHTSKAVPRSAEIKKMMQDGGTALLDADKITEMHVRTFREGDRFTPLGMNNSVKLKDFFISVKVPKEHRRVIPLLVSGEDIIWVVGHRIDERYKVTEQTRNTIQVVAKHC